ncbi:MAG TPA: polysaccharide export protein [Desulfobacterales bacterium]|nr:polysaccharide export protein [Desulfobacterales bacterium]
MQKQILSCVFLILLFFHESNCPCCLAFSEEQAVPAQDESYTPGPEDILEISVWGHEALSKQVVVRPDGKISFPLIGDVTAKGRTVEELRKTMEEKIRGFVPDAPVTVLVMQIRSPKVYVVGKVMKPGMYIMGEPMSVMQVLAMAGGMTTFANKDSVIIIRKENGNQKVFEFDYSKVADGEELGQNIPIECGDTVVVP